MAEQITEVLKEKQERLLRLTEIIGDRKSEPPIPPIIPVSKSTWWAGVKDGRFPSAVHLGARITCWRESEVLALIAKGA